MRWLGCVLLWRTVADLLRELPDQVEADALEARIPDQIVQVVAQVLKDQAQVVAVPEPPKVSGKAFADYKHQSTLYAHGHQAEAPGIL